MRLDDIERYLHEQIPLSAAIHVAVRSADTAGVRLAAPLAPNINHRSTVFGGSAAAVAILAAWTYLHVRLEEFPFTTRVVIQHNSLDYLRPLHGDFEAWCPAPSDALWQRFAQTLERRGRARIVLHAELSSSDEVAGMFQGTYVAQRAAPSELPTPPDA